MRSLYLEYVLLPPWIQFLPTKRFLFFLSVKQQHSLSEIFRHFLDSYFFLYVSIPFFCFIFNLYVCVCVLACVKVQLHCEASQQSTCSLCTAAAWLLVSLHDDVAAFVRQSLFIFLCCCRRCQTLSFFKLLSFLLLLLF